MKIKATNYILHCQCGKQFVKELRKTFVKKIKGEVVHITETKMDCPFCQKERMVKLIGTVEYFGDHNEYSKLHYTLKPVKVGDKWEYREDIPKTNDTGDFKASWTAKEEQWKLEEAYMKAYTSDGSTESETF